MIDLQKRPAEEKGFRDAIHVGVIVASCDELIRPGERIHVDENGNASIRNPEKNAVADPFENDDIRSGELFYAILLPWLIKGMRHVYEIDGMALAREERPLYTTSARGYLQAFAAEAGLSFDEMVDKVKTAVDEGFPFVEHDSERMRDAFYSRNARQFWDAFEELFGVRMTDDESPFSCSC